MPVVAIDGPAGSGKSTVARALATRLGVEYLDTGAMYRSVAFAALREGVDPSDADAVAALARSLSIEVGERVRVDGLDVTEAIRGPDVDRTVSVVAVHPGVRADLVGRQREWVARHRDGVVEGRDIGTVVLPDADLKVFLTASDRERARRRHEESAGIAYEQVASDISRRDELDSTRADSPLRVADDAVVVDTTSRSVAAIVDDLVSRLDAAPGRTTSSPGRPTP